MTSEIIRTVIDDIKNNRDMSDFEKCECLMYVCNYLYIKESAPFRKEIDKLITEWD